MWANLVLKIIIPKQHNEQNFDVKNEKSCVYTSANQINESLKRFIKPWIDFAITSVIKRKHLDFFYFIECPINLYLY